MPPSESSCLRKAGFEGFMMAELRPKVPSLRKVTFFEMGGSAQALAITLHDPEPGEAWDALSAAAARNGAWCKWVIALDDDIDGEDLDSVLWALARRVQPHRDVQIHVSYHPSDMAAAVSSGSFQTLGMIVVPCSMKTNADRR